MVKVDIAGMYYGRLVTLPDYDASADPLGGPTVRDAMIAARLADKSDRADGDPVPQLNFVEDDRHPHEFLRSITVDHKVDVESRQTRSETRGKRFYPAGEYTFRSDPIALGTRTDGTPGIIPVDQDGKPTGKKFIQTWQYYVYDSAGVDTSRRAGGNETRKIVPFSKRDASNTLVDGGQIVWRLVTIFLDATRRPAIKTAVEDGAKLNKSI
ncbi:hypothetical protein [Sphingomonas prati]|nr:hypothetical protein [Sphingomonas prati]